ncbi:hypothetical protein [Cellulosimicrobium sp. CUA-896]|uniref:hypothetical protein n=1 Tax=Cellulosimicrobium sp. CUA-896 TaxID=1517881 RepID=UPI0009630DDC|nr:hypothetical protein [Cellulosimicrobium sp. CUA-896]OLT54636.1 hypothetical protein BJF88_07955 [Cellulosimicrobium sp. CUA-896]
MSDEEPTDRYFSATPALCALVSSLDGPTTAYDYACTEGEQLAYEGIECGADEFAQGALFREVRQPDGTWGPPELVGDEGCITPADLLAEAEREFATLPIAPSPVVVQPPDGWTVVNLPTITYTDAAEQTFDTSLLGIPVQIRATPESYAWDYADGSAPLVTTDPGAPYPDHTVHHTYAQPADAVTIGLTTTWSGQFRITGSRRGRTCPGRRRRRAPPRRSRSTRRARGSSPTRSADSPLPPDRRAGAARGSGAADVSGGDLPDGS